MAENVTIPDGFRLVSQTPAIPDGFKLVSQNEPEKDYTLGRVATADSGLTFGFGRKLGGLINALGSYPVDRAAELMGVENTPSFKDRYNEIVEPAVQAKEEYQRDKPVEATAVNLVSALANPVNKLGAGFIGKGATATAKGLRSVGVGGGVGAVNAIGETENPEDLAGNIGQYSSIGAAIGGAIPLAGAAVRGTGKTLKQVLGKTTGAGDVAVGDAFNAGAKGNTAFLDKMRGNIDADGLEKRVQANFDKIKSNRNQTYNQDITRLKQATADKKLDLQPVINDVKSIMKTESGGADYLLDNDTSRVLAETKDTLNKFYKDKSRHNLEGFDNLKKRLQGINTKEGTNAERVKTNITNSVKNQILKQSPEYKAINDAYAEDTATLNDLKKVFSMNRNANSETVLKKIQSTARNNANTDWTYRKQLLNMLDPTGEIQQEISANALNSWSPRGLLGGGIAGASLFTNPTMLVATSPRAVGNIAYRAGQVANSAPARALSTSSPYVAQLLNEIYNGGN